MEVYVNRIGCLDLSGYGMHYDAYMRGHARLGLTFHPDRYRVLFYYVPGLLIVPGPRPVCVHDKRQAISQWARALWG
jgi:hypothetical protein